MSTANLHLISQGPGPDLDTSSWNLLLNESHYEGVKDNLDEKFQSPEISALVSPSFGSVKHLVERKETQDFNLNLTASPTETKVDHSFLAALVGQGNSLAKREDKSVIETRAQGNWRQLRNLLQAFIAEHRLYELMEERDERIMRGVVHNQPKIAKNCLMKILTWYLKPKCAFLLTWQAVLQFFIIFYALTFTERLVFRSDLHSPGFINVMNMIVDGCILVNIILKFFTAYKLSNGTYVWNKKSIAKKYILHGTFILDVLSIIPYETFDRDLAIIKLVRLIHLKAFAKSMRRIVNLVAPIFFEGFYALLIAKFVGNLTTVLFQMLIIFHLCACLWISLGLPEDPLERTWLGAVVIFDATPSASDLDPNSFPIYVASLFHVVQTLTTVGYGNTPGYSMREHIYSLVLLFVGLLMFVAIFEKVKGVALSLGEAEKLENEEVEDVETWLTSMERNIVESLDVVNDKLIGSFRRILRHKVDQDWQELFVGNEQFRHLSYSMKNQILGACLLPWKERFRMLFKSLSDNFVHHIMISSESRIYQPNEIILDKGEISDGLFLIMEGSVFIAGQTPKMKFIKLPSDSFFGENFLLTRKHSHFHYIADQDVSCLFIGDEIFNSMPSHFAEDIKKLRALAYHRHKYFLREREKHRLSIEGENSKKKKKSPRRVQLAHLKNLASVGSVDTSKLVNNALSKPSSTALDEKLINSPIKRANVSLNEQASLNYSDKPFELEPIVDESQIIRDHYEPLAPIYEAGTLNNADLEGTVNIENVQQEENQDTDSSSSDDDDDSSSDELNRSDIFPIEVKAPNFSDPANAKKIASYLQDRATFIQDKIEQTRARLTSELQYVSQKTKILNRKFSKI